jgi:hypothetical protein
VVERKPKLNHSAVAIPRLGICPQGVENQLDCL